MLTTEDHGLRVASLALLTIDVEPHAQVLRVLHFVLRDEPRSDRAERFAALAFIPLAAAALDLKHALGDVIRQKITGDGVLRFILGEIARALADNDTELHFPVQFSGLARDKGVVVRPTDAGRRLVEDDRLFRNRHAGFRGVVGIVQTDGDEVTHVADTGAEPRLAGNGLHPFEVRLLDLGKAARRKHRAVDIFYDTRQVADLAIVTDDAGLLAARRAKANKLHVQMSPVSIGF